MKMFKLMLAFFNSEQVAYSLLSNEELNDYDVLCEE